jgi:hypothetical protein
MAASFGVVTTIGSTIGYIQNLSITNAVETVEARDETGDVAAFSNYNETNDFSADFVYTTTGTAPSAGDTFVVGSASYNVTSVVFTETNTDYKKCTMSGKRYVTNSLPSA